MVILNEGLNKVRDLLNTNLTKGQNGIGVGTADPEDTGLETAVGSTKQFSSGESLVRIRHTSISKTNSKELRFIVTYQLTGG